MLCDSALEAPLSLSNYNAHRGNSVNTINQWVIYLYAIMMMHATAEMVFVVMAVIAIKVVRQSFLYYAY